MRWLRGGFNETSLRGSDGFEPPKYLASLIAAVNDGAKTAQSGALVFALVGVYLLATAFSASDEDLLRGRTVTISQIGATLPISFSFAIAPLVFVFLHIYTLARYDMLAANVRQFLAELHYTVALEADRERCRQLLANVEFVQALVAPSGSRLYSWIWRWLVCVVIAIFPVFVLLLVQINALRYQSALIMWVQRASLFIDLLALVWFFLRNALKGPESSAEIVRETRRWAGLLSFPVAVMALNLLYLNVVSADADPDHVRANEVHLEQAFSQPLDAVLCPQQKWGCRYLRVDRRTLVDHVWDDKAIVDLWRGSSDTVKALAAIEGLVLRDRSLRFAVLDQSSLVGADLTGTDLRKASLKGTNLPGARLLYAQLQNADLEGAQLQNADLEGAQLQGTSLLLAQLQGADLVGAELQGSTLTGALLQGAALSGAQLQIADFRSAELKGANMSGAWLQNADLRSAQLQGADLSRAKLRGAIFGRAKQQVVASSGPETDLGLADLRDADFATAPTDEDIDHLHAVIDVIPDSNRQSEAAKRLYGWLVPAAPLHFNASPEQQVLVSNVQDPTFEKIPKAWLIDSPTSSYTRPLAALLGGELALADSAIAGRVALRVYAGLDTGKDASMYSEIGCLLIANAQVKLDPQTASLLSTHLQLMKFECKPNQVAASPH